MKTKIFAYTAFFLTIAFVICNTFYLNREIQNLYRAVENFDTESADALEKAITLKKSFEKKEIYISLTVSHDDLTNIEEGLAELVGCLKVSDSDEAEIVKNRLINSLEHLKRLSGVNIDAII